ncbi:hypothetical protein [Brevundimonas sp.]|uniref:hypothetical protein n=1 Tax=Brevundimonas sp. TaxID=1871086 RepID=UPI003D120E44
MTTTTETRRSVMKVAWSLFREAARSEDARSFADALAGAWRWVKKLAKRRPTRSRGAFFVRSPIARRYGPAAYVGGRASPAYLASRMGA